MAWTGRWWYVRDLCFDLFLGYSQAHFSNTLQPVIPWKSFALLHNKVIFLVQRQLMLPLEANTVFCNRDLCGNQDRVKNTKSSIPNSFGAATRVGSQSPTERRKILPFLKWEDAHFCFRNPFSFSLAAQLQHSFYTYAYIDDSLEILTRTHFSLSFSTPKFVVKCFLLQESGSFLLEEGKVTALPSLPRKEAQTWLFKAHKSSVFCTRRKWPTSDL